MYTHKQCIFILYHHIVATTYTKERERELCIVELLVCTLQVCGELGEIMRLPNLPIVIFFLCQVFSPRSAKLALGLYGSCKSGKSGKSGEAYVPSHTIHLLFYVWNCIGVFAFYGRACWDDFPVSICNTKHALPLAPRAFAKRSLETLESRRVNRVNLLSKTLKNNVNFSVWKLWPQTSAKGQ